MSSRMSHRMDNARWKKNENIGRGDCKIGNGNVSGIENVVGTKQREKLSVNVVQKDPEEGGCVELTVTLTVENKEVGTKKEEKVRDMVV